MPTVYLADRDASFRKALAHSLRRGGADVTTFINGVDLYARALAQEPDLIVLDADLEEMNGFEVFGSLMRRRPERPPRVVFVTHLDKWGIEERVLELGAVDYLLKDRPPEEILEAIERHLRERTERPIAETAKWSFEELAEAGYFLGYDGHAIAPRAAIPDVCAETAPRTAAPVMRAETAPHATLPNERSETAPRDASLEVAESPAAAAVALIMDAARSALQARIDEMPHNTPKSVSTPVVSSAATRVPDRLVSSVRAGGSARPLGVAVRRRAASVQRVWDLLMAAAMGLLTLARDIIAAVVRGGRKVAATSARLLREASETVVAAATSLATGSRKVCAVAVAGMRARVRNLGVRVADLTWRTREASATAIERKRKAAVFAATELAGYAEAIGIIAIWAGKTIGAISVARMRRAREGAGQAATAFTARARTGLASGVTSVKGWELEARARAPVSRGALVRHRAPLVAVAEALFIMAVIVTLLPEGSREMDAVIQRSQRPDGGASLTDGPTRGRGSQPTRGRGRQKELERKPTLDLATAPGEDLENGADDLPKSGDEARTAAPHLSPLSAYSPPKAERFSVVRTVSNAPVPAPVRRAGRSNRAETLRVAGSEYSAAALPFGPLGQRNELAWRSTFRVAGSAPVRPGVIDEDRDGVPDVRPPILVERVVPQLPLGLEDLAEPRAVLLGIRVGSDGRARQVQVKRSSGYDLLDQAAVEAVSRFRWQPARGVSGRQDHWIELAITFGRRGGEG
jgi:protein TonB